MFTNLTGADFISFIIYPFIGVFKFWDLNLCCEHHMLPVALQK